MATFTLQPPESPAPDPAQVERVIAALEPLLLPRRVERMKAVLATRSDHATFVFERMTNPHNLSAALRSLDAFSFQEAWWIAPGEKLDLSHLISRGTHRWLTLRGAESPRQCVDALRRRGYRVYASHLGGEGCVPLGEIDFRHRTALVFGNEHAGVGGELLELADARFRIDMLGFAESLNLSVAVALSAWHARREIERLGAAGGDPASYQLTPGQARALYAQWLQESVRRADAVLERGE